jgi:hypothetical protein
MQTRSETVRVRRRCWGDGNSGGCAATASQAATDRPRLSSPWRMLSCKPGCCRCTQTTTIRAWTNARDPYQWADGVASQACGRRRHGLPGGQTVRGPLAALDAVGQGIQPGRCSPVHHSERAGLGHRGGVSVRDHHRRCGRWELWLVARIGSWSHLIRAAELALPSAVQADAVPADRLVLPVLAHGQRMPPARVPGVGPRELLAVRKLEVDAQGELVGEP